MCDVCIDTRNLTEFLREFTDLFQFISFPGSFFAQQTWYGISDEYKFIAAEEPFALEVIEQVLVIFSVERFNRLLEVQLRRWKISEAGQNQKNDQQAPAEFIEQVYP